MFDLQHTFWPALAPVVPHLLKAVAFICGFKALFWLVRIVRTVMRGRGIRS